VSIRETTGKKAAGREDYQMFACQDLRYDCFLKRTQFPPPETVNNVMLQSWMEKVKTAQCHSLFF